jgi:hypothetical protein
MIERVDPGPGDEATDLQGRMVTRSRYVGSTPIRGTSRL